jgi:AmmeMemoRadiSam system protein B
MTLLPALRGDLDMMPSPVADHPGLLIRDPFRYSDATIVIPPPLVPLLRCFDGRTSELELRERLVRLTGDLEVTELLRHLVGTLSGSGFLEDEVSAGLKRTRVDAFARAEERLPAHIGSAYPGEGAALRATLQRYLEPEGPAPAPARLGIAAPHVSPEGGFRSYAAAYAALPPPEPDRTVVVLGTSHFGEAEKFGLTRKPFVTPLGRTRTDLDVVNSLARAAPDAVVMEDYCHAVEHAIEFQVLFLQHLWGPDVSVVPILCGPFAKSTLHGGRPEDDPGVAAFLDALGQRAAREGERLYWVLGIDLAHQGRRYGDGFGARTGSPDMEALADRDRRRLEPVLAGDAPGFWERLQQDRDPLRWCGASPLYAFLAAVRPGAGLLLRYEQWNIDPDSVVSFAGVGFSPRG